jgi:hypothetical protein
MHPVPQILNAILSNKLIFAVLSSCSLAPLDSSGWAIHSFSDNYKYVNEFSFGGAQFREVSFLIDSEGYPEIQLRAGNGQFVTQQEAYFGSETIYTPIQKLLEEKGITPPRPYQYLYRDFDVPIYVHFSPMEHGLCSIRIISNPNRVFAKTVAEDFLGE